MNALARFGTAFRSLESTALGVVELLPSRLSTAAVAALHGVDAAGLSLFGGEWRVPIGSSDTAAALAEQLQFTAGEGPCFAAHGSQRVVTADQYMLIERWPQFANGLLNTTPYQAVLSVPLQDGLADLVTLDLYFHRSVRAADMPLEQATLVATLVSAALTHNQLSVATDELVEGPPWLNNPSTAARFLVPVVSGMVLARTGQGFPDALALLRDRASADSRTVDALAADIVHGEVPIDALIS